MVVIKPDAMKRNLHFPMCCFLAAASLLGCAGNNTQTADKGAAAAEFPQVQVPSYINDREQAVNYMVRNFWNKFMALPNQDGNKLSGRSAIHGVDSLSFEKAFGMYAQLLKAADRKAMEISVQKLFAKLDSLAETGERKPLLAVMQRAEHYFYDPNSPVLDEEIYLCTLNGILAARSLSELDKMQYEYQHRICSLNRVGTPAADFAFRQFVSGNNLPDSNSQM